jgi:hypothetical protein
VNEALTILPIISTTNKLFTTEEKQFIDLLSAIIVDNIFKTNTNEKEMHGVLEVQ